MTAVSPGSTSSNGAGMDGSLSSRDSAGMPTVAWGVPGVLTTKSSSMPTASAALAPSSAMPAQVISALAWELPSW